MSEAGAVLAAASIIAGFGVTVIMFRLQRELKISDENWRSPEEERIPTWIPLSDFLVIGAILLAFLLGVLPLLDTKEPAPDTLRLAVASCEAATVLLAGYVPSILAHYHFIFWLHKERPYFSVWETALVVLTVAGAVLAFSIELMGD